MNITRRALIISLVLVGCSIFVDGQIWTQLSAVGSPTTAIGSSLVYDHATNEVILFGGQLSVCCTSFNDVWVLTNADGLGGTPVWSKLSPATPNGAPQPRSFHSAVYDTANNIMIIFGGGQSSSIGYFDPLFNDVWVLTDANGVGGTSTWIPLSPTGGPPAAREGHGAWLDSANNRMIVFGGGNNGIMDVPNDLWVLTNANGMAGTPTWVLLSPTGQIPAAVERFASGFDSANNRIMIFGGCCYWNNNTWLLTNANGVGSNPVWSQINPSGTPPAIREVHVYGYDPSLNELIFFGDGSGCCLYNDTWSLSSANDLGETPSWTDLIRNGAPGSPAVESLGGDTAAYDPISARLMFEEDKDNGQGGIVVVPWVLALNGTSALRFFPLKGTATNQDAKLNPWTAPIITVFDHSMADSTGKFHIYGFDGTVEAFTSEVGECSYTPPPCPAKRDGYYNSGTTAFGANGHYIGDSSDGSTLKLQYEGHPGFDYKASCTLNSQRQCILGTGTNVYAVTSGTLHYPGTMVGLCSGAGCAAEYHVMELIPSGTLSHLVYYLHLSTYPGEGVVTATDPSPAPGCPSTVVLPLSEGKPVGAGCLIAQSGNSAPPPGVRPHLHFEVQAVLPPAGFPSSVNCQVNGAKMACVPVDPYGWTCGSDPYSLLLPISNSPLWNYGAYLSSSAVCFGQESVGTTAQQSLTLTNVAVSTLGLKLTVVGGAAPGDFSQSNNCPPLISSGGSCQFTVTFDPAMSGARSATLTITGNDGSGAVRLVVNLSGSGS